MQKLLISIPSPFKSENRTKNADATESPSTGGSSANVSNWERARNVSFAWQHRYGSVAGSFSGILHIASLAYSYWRDADNPKFNRAEELAKAERLAKGLQHLAKFILDHNKPLPHPVDFPPPPEHLERILQMLDAYCTGASSSRPHSFDDASQIDWTSSR
ncbi:MAG: hypothetical protein RB191_15940 [Terriglobia bacterium]|nr:hypothetical protein [Terriglobia bacterium]